MAATTQPLVWDFFRKVSDTGSPGATVHFYDNTIQELYVDNGLQTDVAEVAEGHWKDISQRTAYSIDDKSYTDLSFDHAYNGILFGSSVIDGKLDFLRYVYAIDCTEILDSSSTNNQIDSSVASLKANLKNLSPEFFFDGMSLFQPGSKITVKTRIGEQEAYPIGVFFMDSFDYTDFASVCTLNARNSIGSRLMESTFDDETTISGYPQDVIAFIFGLAGITKYHIQTGDWYSEWEFKADQTLFDGLQQVLEFYSIYRMVELPDGFIAVGYPWWVATYYQSNGYYVINVDQIFKRSIKQSSDAAYTQVMLTGKDDNDVEFTPIILPITNFSAWALPAHKTYHIEAPKGYTEQEFEDYAASVAEALQQIGITETITSIFIPQLIPGDIMAINNGDGTSTVLGIVTSVRHKMGKTGYFTEFTTDSGGVVQDEQSQTVTVTRSVAGYNRKQTLKDLIKIVSKK